MRLKCLELVGFKSFLEPTTIGFASGITAVVGPNGCGKSNVVDAIRWVLGEQAPTRLRGKTIEDLIHSGSDANPPSGMAEVALTIEADDNGALPEPFAALSEVCVTRRAYRSGDSEYLLNKIPCRLKDIAEFFMAAQIHSRGYALIEQGRIEEIIQAKPDELRTLVEEAAGLVLFKGRRDISARKLERVKENLARLDDVLSEIERQLNFARRQAKKAETYRQVRHELDELERLGAAHRLLGQRDELANQARREDGLRIEIDGARAKLAEIDRDTRRLDRELEGAHANLSAAARELDNLRAAALERARTRDFLLRRRSLLDQNEPELIARLAELGSRAVLARASRAAAGARLARESSGDGGGEAALARLSEAHAAALAELKQAEAQIEELRDELSDAIREAAIVRGRLADLAGERAELDQRARTSDTNEIQSELVAAQGDLAAIENQLGALRAEGVSLEADDRDAADRELEARTALAHAEGELTAARDARARLEAGDPGNGSNGAPLKDAINGASDRLRVVLDSLNGDRPASPPRFLLDALDAPPRFQPALRAVLGDQEDAIMVESPDFAIRAIGILKQTNSGRLSFVPEPDVAAQHESIAAPGIAGRLLDLISAEPAARAAAEALLGHVIVADDLPSALAASNLNGHGALFVTIDGDVVSPGRLISGGSLSRSDGSEHSTGTASNARAALEAAEKRKGSLKERFADAQIRRGQSHSALAGLRQRVVDLDRLHSDKRAALSRVENQVAFGQAQHADAARRLAELGELIPASNARLEELALAEQASRQRLAEHRSQLTAREAAAQQLGQSMLEAASRVEARKAELSALEQELDHAAELSAEIESQIDHDSATLSRTRAERAEFEHEVAKLLAQDEAACKREAELDAESAPLRSRCGGLERELESRRAELKLAGEQLAALEADALDCRLKAEHARTLSDELRRSFAERFTTDFEAVAIELEAAIAGRDAQADEARLAELRARAERIGEVNLAAESEVKELEERAGVLGAERSDLQAAVRDLTQTIVRLNREARQRFAETFEGAARNFAELFPKLMRGGKGRLELIEASDVLEAGINVLVQPAGKKVKEIGLLSGGEKALSAMALVFSLFLLNPSPFCVLDEVDAPLDEFSLAAFTSLLEELKRRAQFIVITHNQRTMQRADQIHGVTMERPGVSKIISLKIPAAA